MSNWPILNVGARCCVPVSSPFHRQAKPQRRIVAAASMATGKCGIWIVLQIETGLKDDVSDEWNHFCPKLAFELVKFFFKMALDIAV